MKNQPKYKIFSNTKYALNGLADIYKHETSFRLEVYIIALLSLCLWFLPFSFASKSILQISLFLPLLVEAINSSIERVVDLVTKDYHELAKTAKDAGSAAVFISICISTAIWLAVFVNELT